MTGNLKLVVILGPTASGKSSLAIKLAQKINGEIVSADSRQVYKGMDIGTGKVSKKEQRLVPHYLLDIASPKRQFTVAQFKKAAQLKIFEINRRGRLPFLVGGTAFYIYSLIDNLALPEVKPNAKLRAMLEKKTPAQLFAMLQKLDPRRAQNIDKQNKVRLIRAIEIIKSSGKVPVLIKSFPYNTLILGLTLPQEKLYKAIDKRLEERLKSGLVKEARRLVQSGISHKKLQRFGLEYRAVSEYLQGKIEYGPMIEQLKNDIHHYAKRQMTWFKRDKRIIWVKNQREAGKLVRTFLKQ